MKAGRQLTFLGLVILLTSTISVFSQEKTFTIQKENWTSPQKLQGNNGCQIFSMVSFFESEIFRTSKQKLELSQMYLFYHVFIEKTDRYLRLRGTQTYSTGGLFDDAIFVMNKYGIVPLSDYVGNRNDKGYYEHGQLYGEFEYGFLPNLMKKAENHELNISWENGVATKQWESEIRSMLDRHLGNLPAEISFEGKTYTPLSFAKEVVNLPLTNYIKLTSFSEMPFYQPGMFYVKDNWLCKSDYFSLPLDKFMETIDYAVNNGFTLAIDLDYTVDILKSPVNYVDFNENETVTQDKRDEMLSNWLTKDVHLVHLTGIATDENGRKYYVIKDSVGENLGVVTKKYLSENFVKGKVMAVILHKDGIPSAIKKQLN